MKTFCIFFYFQKTSLSMNCSLRCFPHGYQNMFPQGQNILDIGHICGTHTHSDKKQ